MADIRKLRRGQRIIARHGGIQYEGVFTTFIPARPTATDNASRRERFVLRNEAVVMYIPVENTVVKHDRRSGPRSLRIVPE